MTTSKHFVEPAQYVILNHILEKNVICIWKVSSCCVCRKAVSNNITATKQADPVISCRGEEGYCKYWCMCGILLKAWEKSKTFCRVCASVFIKLRCASVVFGNDGRSENKNDSLSFWNHVTFLWDNCCLTLSSVVVALGTSMHSSRMRSARLLTVCQGRSASRKGGGCPHGRVLHAGGSASGEGSAFKWGRVDPPGLPTGGGGRFCPTPWSCDRQTNTSENITLLQSSLAGGDHIWCGVYV